MVNVRGYETSLLLKPLPELYQDRRRRSRRRSDRHARRHTGASPNEMGRICALGAE